MNSRFDEAVEQILSDHVVMEATPGMASAPGAQPEKKGTSVLGGIARLVGGGIKGAAKVAGQAASVGMGLTPSAAGTAFSKAADIGRGIASTYRGDAQSTQTSTQPSQTTTPTPTTTTPTTPTKTVANIIPTIQPQKITSSINNFPKLNADKTHLQSAIPNLLRGLRGNNYTAQDLVQMVTGSIPPGTQVRQIANNNAAMNKINTDLQNYLALNDKDRTQLKAQIPALLRGIKSTATIEDVGQLLTNVMS